MDEQEIQQLWDSIRKEVLRRGGDVHTAEDVAQEAWLRAVRSPPEERGRLRGWLHVVAQRLLQEQRTTERHRSHRERAVARFDHAAPMEATEPSVLARYLEELDEAQRVTLQLRYVEGLSVTQIAARMGLSPEAVRSRLKRGLVRLRARTASAPERRSWARCTLAWIVRAGRDFLGPEGSSARHTAAAGVVVLVGLSTWLLLGARSPVEEGAPEVRVAPTAASGVVLEDAPPPASRARVDEQDRGAPSAAPESAGLRMSGFVLTPEGTPVPGALVHAAPTFDSAPGTVTTADGDGRYEIVVGRRDLLWASANEWCDSRACYVPSVSAPGALDLVLARTRGRADVLVLDARGAPVAAARVQLEPLERADQTQAARGTVELSGPAPSGTTDAGGRVELPFPARAWVDVLVVADGFPPWLESLRTPEPGGTLRCVLPAPAAVSGVCVDGAGNPLWKARVEALQLGSLVRRETLTGPDGSFRIEALAPGPFVLRCTEDLALGGRSARLQDSLEAGASKAVRLELDERTSIHGIVLGDPPSEGQAVYLLPRGNPAAEGNSLRSTWTDAGGRFVFGGCGPGQHRLSTQADGDILGLKAEAVAGRKPEVLGPANGPRAPIELVFEGGDDATGMLLELRAEPSFSKEVWLAPGTRRFQSEPLGECPLDIVVWTAELGAWSAGERWHRPARPVVHTLRVPRAATLVVALELPDGVRHEDVELAVETSAFNSYGLGSAGRTRALRELRWDGARAAHVVRLPPGTYPLLLGGAGLAQRCESVSLTAGEERVIRLAPELGLETRILFRSPHALRANEALQLDVLTPSGTSRITLRNRHQRVHADGFAFTVWLPAETIQLEAWTKFGGSAAAHTLAGRRTLAPGELDVRAQAASLELELELAPARR